MKTANPTAAALLALIALSMGAPLPPSGTEERTDLVSKVATTIIASAIASHSAAPSAIVARYPIPSNSTIVSRNSTIVDVMEEDDEDNEEEVEEFDEDDEHVERRGTSSSGGSKGSSGSKGGSSSSSSGRGTTSVPKTSTPKTSSTNGRTTISTSGGSYYVGGGSKPYSVGSKSVSRSGLGTPYSGSRTVWTGPYFWYYPYPVWYYPYPANEPWIFYNQTTNKNESIPVVLACQQYADCTADYNNDPDYIKLVLGNGAYKAWNSSIASVQLVNNVKSVLINATVANGTSDITSWGVPAAAVPSVRLLMSFMALVMMFQLFM